jgi:signal transduction histidine kinase
MLPVAAAVTGVAAIAVCVGCAVAVGKPGALLPVGLAVLWWVAGLLALAARPDHLSARLLTAVGLLHLVGFAVSAGLSVSTTASWPAWSATLLANVLYDLGFAALAVLLATFPNARLQRVALPLATAGVAIVFAVIAALTSARVDLPLHVDRSAVAAPGLLPLGSHAADLTPALPVLVVIGLLGLLRRTVKAPLNVRRQLLWPAAVFGVVVVMLAATPAGTHVLGRGWTLVFVPIVGMLPFALLAGVRRFRMLQVELYAARTLAYAAVVALVVCIYAAAAAVVGSRSAPAAIVVAAVAAVSGHPLRMWLEARVDRIISGGRIRGHMVLRHLADSLDTAHPERIARRTAETVASGLDVAWVTVTCPPDVDVTAGIEAVDAAQVTVPLVAAETEVGAIACGPRRGGWSEDDVALLRLLARHAALALHGGVLTVALARKVEELTASRERLVRAEDEARRGIERDLHDGIQQHLVVLLGRLGMLRTALDEESVEGTLATQSYEQAQRSLNDLRALVRGIHPPLLTDRGLVAAVEAQADLLSLPVTVDVDPRLEGVRFAPEVEAAAYYVVCEATTNVIKHSGAARARVVLTPLEPGGLQVAIVDEGAGFTEPGAGSGLRGLRDRVDATGGSITVTSTEGVGTTVVARFPERTLTDA